MKPILVIWQEDLHTFVYSFPFQGLILDAHGAFIGNHQNTSEMEIAVNTIRLLIRNATPLPPLDLINCELYSNVVICGILEEV